MAWFPHELIDAVTCCNQHSRVLGNPGDKSKDHRTVAHRTSNVLTAFDRIAGKNTWQGSLIFLWMIFLEHLEKMEKRVRTRLRKDFQVGSEDWNDVTFSGQRIRWIKRSSN